MKICQKNFDFAAGPQELSDLDGRNEVSCMWAAGGCCAPKDFERVHSQDSMDDIRTADLLHIRCDEIELLVLDQGRSRDCRRHFAGHNCCSRESGSGTLICECES